MNKHALVLALCVAVSSIVALSCATSKPAAPSEDEIIKAGAREFAEGKIAQAERIWSEIPDQQKRSQFLSFAKAYSSFDTAVAEAERALAESRPEAAIAAAKGSGGIPAAPAPLEAPDPRDARARLAKVADEAGNALITLAIQAERAADGVLASARKGKPQAGAELAARAAAGFLAAAKDFGEASNWVPDATAGAVASAGAVRAEAKAATAAELRRALLKESLLGFSDNLGELFARSPSTERRLGDKELLEFSAETATMISGGISNFERLIAENPGLLDQATIDRYRDSARGLSARFARIEAIAKSVRNKGRPVMPVMIGIFNPEPDDPQRSRPATFAGEAASGSDWWWGIADIPKGLAQDLVITMSDSRPVRIYATGPGAGAGGKKQVSDLVNPLFKVGNSWPVLNAGARLDNGVFHIEVGPGGGPGYVGEAVVYKSFMMRTR